MYDSELTLSSPLGAAAGPGQRLLTLTLLWHPDSARIGEQFICTGGAETVALNRYLPLFSRPGMDGLPLGHGGISRDPVHLVRGSDDTLRLCPPNSRMVVELNGVEVGAAASADAGAGVALTAEQLEAGAVLGLGRAVLICIHWMDRLPKNNPVPGMLGVGAAAVKARDLVRQAAASDAPVLLLGETGTGKEVAARAIHALGKRAAAPLVSVNMAVLNESLAAADLFGAAKGAYTGAQGARSGLFAQADKGTLFLDEVGNTPAAIQPMLLRVLESGEYRPLGAREDERSDARLIAATDQDVYSAGFNQPLLRRLESLVIRLPSLRERREDIGVLIAHLLADNEVARTRGIVPPATFISDCVNYDWPGNIRQLGHVLKRAMLALADGETPAFAEFVDAPQLVATASAALAAAAAGAGDNAADNAVEGGGQGSAQAGAPRKRLADVSDDDVLAAMEAHGWAILGAAQALGISRPSMYKLLDGHPQIRRPEQIAPDALRAALAESGGQLAACASRLKTPSEALRRHLNGLGLLGAVLPEA